MSKFDCVVTICCEELFELEILALFRYYFYENSFIYSLYKKKRKPYIMFHNSSNFKDEHFKLAGYLDWHVPNQ